MKLVRFGEPGQEKPGILLHENILDASSFGEDFNEAFFTSGGMDRLKGWLNTKAANLPVVQGTVRLGPPFGRPSKIICIGLNYSDHAKESKMELPKEPVIFFKSTTAICGPNDPLVIPRESTKTDWEVELAVVIGRKTSYISESEAAMHIAGYCLHNDYSEREFQLERSGQWVKGKSCDTFAPLGPWLVTPDEVPNVNNLEMWLTLNGNIMQMSNTNQMVFKIPFLVSHLSQFMTLLPGDVISTGTPAGVGLGLKPPVYIKKGDTIKLGIEGMGEQQQTAI